REEGWDGFFTDSAQHRGRSAVYHIGVGHDTLLTEKQPWTILDFVVDMEAVIAGPTSSKEAIIHPTEDLLSRYRSVRGFTESLCEPLVDEDYVVQTMDDVSPTKWHLAHVSWFFETFVLAPHAASYRPFHPAYAYLFNSYYVQAGERHCRDKRGYLSRPTVREVYRYRAYVDEHVQELLATADEVLQNEIAPLVEIGLNHEQQHQELLLTDIKHVFSVNPLRPVYRPFKPAPAGISSGLRWMSFDEGVYEVGHEGSAFAYDNEGPRHRVYLNPFLLASRPITNREYLAFMEDAGYRRPELWLSEGWKRVQEKDWEEPFYWERRDGAWYTYTLAGLREVDLDEPICHVSYFEADAYARWAGARLPTENEWEIAAREEAPGGNFVERGHYHPVPPGANDDGSGFYGNVWEWTRSPYAPYPGYRPDPGALGEYNGKFMCNQFVLRGGSCATSVTHIRPTYRNFFPPDATWQFTGFRLAKDVW
ncbi:MAG TPA: ergothioneine biosynthesis protein EgtB, partial [Rhodothermales bacterium]|nr:ergothioneine biosynthesis protein EgtB [Rhodothermales bacterium]